MSYTYEVPKGKANRFSYRILGTVFLVVAILQFMVIFKGEAKHIAITTIFATILLCYGSYLVLRSFRKTAYSIKYLFNEEGLTVTHHYGVKSYSFDDIEFITMVIPDASLIFYMLNIKAGKDIYTIPFTMKKDYCEKIYEFVNARIKHED